MKHGTTHTGHEVVGIDDSDEEDISEESMMNNKDFVGCYLQNYPVMQKRRKKRKALE
jgi:hypothetical protein